MPANRKSYIFIVPPPFLQFQPVVRGPDVQEPVPLQNPTIRPRVLVVDDVAIDLKTIGALLGPRCDLAIAGPENPDKHALEIWDWHPELLLAIVYLRMPDRHGVLSVDVGFTLIEELRKRPGAVILIYSGEPEASVQARANSLGIAKFVRKQELDPDELVAQLQRLAALQAEEPELNHNWALSNPDVLNQYSGKVVAVYGFKVLASGRDHSEARSNALAQPDCPDEDKLTLVTVPRQPWFDQDFFCTPLENAITAPP